MVLQRKATTPASVDQRIFRFLLHRAKSLVTDPGNVHTVRRRMESLARLQPVPSGVSIKRVDTAGIRAEWITPDGEARNRVILYIHGGAFVYCSPATHRPLTAKLALASRLPALSLCYRLAPEHPFPAALEDCLAGYRWLLSEGIAPDRIVVGGDSAGGNLTLVLMLALREAGEPLPAGAFCFSPLTDMTIVEGSRLTRAQADPIFGDLKHPERMVESYYRGHDPRNPLLSPVYADLHGLPPLLVHVGEDEILLDDSTRVVERAQAAGVDARVVVWPGMWHVFQAFGMFIPEAQQSIDEIGEFIQNILFP